MSEIITFRFFVVNSSNNEAAVIKMKKSMKAKYGRIKNEMIPVASVIMERTVITDKLLNPRRISLCEK